MTVLEVSNEDYPELTTDLPKEIAKKKRQGKFVKTNTNRQVKQERKAKRNVQTQRERLEVEELNTTAQYDSLYKNLYGQLGECLPRLAYADEIDLSDRDTRLDDPTSSELVSDIEFFATPSEKVRREVTPLATARICGLGNDVGEDDDFKEKAEIIRMQCLMEREVINIRRSSSMPASRAKGHE